MRGAHRTARRVGEQDRRQSAVIIASTTPGRVANRGVGHRRRVGGPRRVRVVDVDAVHLLQPAEPDPAARRRAAPGSLRTAAGSSPTWSPRLSPPGAPPSSPNAPALTPPARVVTNARTFAGAAQAGTRPGGRPRGGRRSRRPARRRRPRRPRRRQRQRVEQRGEVVGQRARERHRRAARGMRQLERHACSACARKPRARGRRTARRPTSGWPRCARWTRIWCVRPVSSRHSTEAARSTAASRSTCVTAGRPRSGGTTAIRSRSRGSRPIGASIVKRGGGTPSTTAT